MKSFFTSIDFDVHSQVKSGFAFFFDHYCSVLENASIKYQHHHLLIEPIHDVWRERRRYVGARLYL